MPLKRSGRPEISPTEPLLDSAPSPSEVFTPSEIIDLMIDLRCQLAELERQIEELRPLFFAACFALNTDTIAVERAIISRRLTPARWLYSPDIFEREDLLKQLKREFQQTHEPSGGREVTWFIKLLLLTA